MGWIGFQVSAVHHAVLDWLRTRVLERVGGRNPMAIIHRRLGGRRDFLKAAGCFTAAALVPGRLAWAQAAKLRIGLMLPYTGTYAALGNAITNGFKLAVTERGGKLGGRELEYFTVDDEPDPSKAPENPNKLLQRDNVDGVIGTVCPALALAMVQVPHPPGTLSVIPNAGAAAATGEL